MVRQLSFVPAYAVLDVETTGFSAERDRIVEVAVVRVEGRTIANRWSTLVNPGMPIPFHAQQAHGISDADVAGAPPLRAVLPALKRIVRGATIVAHNASFDRSFLPMLHDDWLCTLALAREAFPDAPNHKLGTLIAHTGIGAELGAIRLHRAAADAEATALLLAACLERLRIAA